MATPRDALNELKWRHGALDEVVVWYVHRGAPGDRRAVAGASIVAIGRSFFHIEGPQGGSWIPYHRVLRIERGGEAVWVRGADSTAAWPDRVEENQERG